jgi:hypothetical protein
VHEQRSVWRTFHSAAKDSELFKRPDVLFQWMLRLLRAHIRPEVLLGIHWPVKPTGSPAQAQHRCALELSPKVQYTDGGDGVRRFTDEASAVVTESGKEHPFLPVLVDLLRRGE